MAASMFTIRIEDQRVPVEDLVQFWAEANLGEAATVKSRAKRLLNDIKALLADRTVPKAVRDELEDVRDAMRRTWADLASAVEPEEARGEGQGVGSDRQGDGGAATCVCPDCGATLPHERGVPCAEVACPKCGATMTGETEAVEAMEFAEGAAGAVLDVLSEGPTVIEDGVGPMVMTVKLIEPGWGNKRDNNYYSAEMLKRDAHVFDGSMMFETDHRQPEKNTRTWVSTVRKVTGFTESGAPIAEVVVHSPDFAQRVRNLKAAGMLHKLPASILAKGKARKGEVSGRKGMIVESIVEARGVDWVTKAGAGGQALDVVSESEPDDNVKVEDAMSEKVIEEVAVEDVTVEEKDPVQAPALGVLRAAAMLTESGLPTVAIERLAEGDYENEEALANAIATEKAYLTAATAKPKTKPVAETEPVVSGNGAVADIVESDAAPDYTKVNELLGWNPTQG